tara:strand:- start:9862 stop:10137 length:276 start_codon:yes stop_codon:yes gene_type:complete
LVGGHGGSAADKFSNHFTPEQDKALREYLKEKQVAFPSITKISGHNEYAANKGCPSFDVPTWFKSGSFTKPKPASPLLAWIIRLLGGRADA